MAKHRIAVLPGDGVGRDVIEATMIVLDNRSARVNGAVVGTDSHMNILGALGAFGR